MRIPGLALVSLALACASARPPHPAAVLPLFIEAMESANTDALVSLFADDATVFMPFDSIPQRLQGKEEIRRAFQPFFESLQRRATSPPPYMSLEPRDVVTTSLGDVAIITFHLGRMPEAGATAPVSFSRRTLVVRRACGRWLVSHLHASNVRVPPPQ